MATFPVRDSGRLYEGEMALYSGSAFDGESHIVWRDIPNLAEMDGIEESAESVRLGPGTSCTGFSAPGFSGQDDVFHLDDESLDNLDSTHSMYSTRIFTAPAANPVLSTASVLADDYRTEGGRLLRNADDSLRSFTVFRTTITFAPEVREVEIWASEQTSLKVDDRSFDVDAVAPARFEPDAAHKLVIAMDADRMAAPALLLRTNTMGLHERVFVFPDQDAHNKVAALPDDAFWNKRRELGIKADFSQADCAHAQAAIRNIALAMQSVGGAPGDERRLIVADNMEFASWSLDLGAASNGNAVFRPISKEEGDTMRAGAISIDDRLSQSFLDVIREAGGAVDRFVIRPAGDAASEAAHALKAHVIDPIKEKADPLLESLEDNVIKPLADKFDAGRKALEDALKHGLEVLIQLGDKAYTFLADTASKLGDLGHQILDQIGAGLSKLYDSLRDLFDWGDMLQTHNMLRDAFNDGLGRASVGIADVKPVLKTALKDIRGDVVDGIDKLLEQIGLNDSVGSSDPQARPPEAAQSDHFEWFSSKLASNMRHVSSPGAEAELAGPIGILQNIIGVLQERIEQDGPAIMDALQKALADLSEAVKEPSRAPALILGVLLELVKAAALAGISLMDAILEIVLDAIAAMLDGLGRYLNKPIEIPFISDLYRAIARGRDLSLMGLTCLLLAIPFTIMSKSILGKAPSAVLGRLALDTSNQTARLFATGFICATLVSGVLDAIIEGCKVAKFDIAERALGSMNVLVCAAILACSSAFGFKRGASQIDPAAAPGDWKTAPDYWVFVCWYLGWGALGLQIAGVLAPRPAAEATEPSPALPKIKRLAETPEKFGGLDAFRAKALTVAALVWGMLSLACAATYIASTSERLSKVTDESLKDQGGSSVISLKGMPFVRLALVVAFGAVPPLLSPIADLVGIRQLRVARVAFTFALAVASIATVGVQIRNDLG